MISVLVPACAMQDGKPRHKYCGVTEVVGADGSVCWQAQVKVGQVHYSAGGAASAIGAAYLHDQKLRQLKASGMATLVDGSINFSEATWIQVRECHALMLLLLYTNYKWYCSKTKTIIANLSELELSFPDYEAMQTIAIQPLLCAWLVPDANAWSRKTCLNSIP
jgi:hypothetical protein